MNTISSQILSFETYSTPHGTVPFDKIKTEHYVPAIRMKASAAKMRK